MILRPVPDPWEPASDLRKLVGDTGIEPVTSSVSKSCPGLLRRPSRGRQTFRDYVEKTWLLNHEIESSTRQSYTYVLRIRILPEFGDMRMMDILPEHVREWVARMKAGPTSQTCAAPSDQEADRPTGRRRAGVPPTRHRARGPTARAQA